MNAMDLWEQVDKAMGATEQEAVLSRMRATYGRKAFTIHHLNYKLVGVKRGDREVYAIGDTWKQAIDRLVKKVAA